MSAATGPASVPASVLFLRLPGLAGQPAGEQERRRELLAGLARTAAANWPADARLVLQSPDGLAVVGRGDPAIALEAARQAAVDAGSDKVGIGLHHGAISSAGPAGQARLTGDGLDTAAAIAGFASPHPFLASLAFRDAVAAGSAQQAAALRPAGELVDQRLRPHALYAFDAAVAEGQSRRRNLLGALLVLGLVGAGVAGREARQRYIAARRPAVLLLDVRPSGEIWVDGALAGTAPALARLELPAGPHSIELRHPRARPVRLDVQLQPGEELKLNHVFPPPPPPPPAPRQQARRPRSLTDRFEGWVRGL